MNISCLQLRFHNIFDIGRSLEESPQPQATVVSLTSHMAQKLFSADINIAQTPKVRKQEEGKKASESSRPVKEASQSSNRQEGSLC